MMAGSRALRIAEEMGVRVAGEAFADRAYTADGKLVSRRLKGAVITDPQDVTDRVIKMVLESKVVSVDNTEVDLGKIDTICVHGDTPTAVDLVKAIRANLEERGIKITSMATFL